MKQYEKEQAKIAQLEKSAEQLRMWAFQGMDKTYRRAISMERRIERMRTTAKPTKARKMDARFTAAEFHGDEVLGIRSLSKSFGEKKLFEGISLKVEGGERIALIGDNGTGKSTVLDAVSYAVSGNRDFNSAAQDRDRSVRSYVRGDTKSSGARRFLRSGAVVSYIALEFWSAQENAHFVAGVCVESKDELSDDSFWFVRKNAVIDDFNFYVKKDSSLSLIHI